jgi:hypothetical protein
LKNQELIREQQLITHPPHASPAIALRKKCGNCVLRAPVRLEFERQGAIIGNLSWATTEIKKEWPGAIFMELDLSRRLHRRDGSTPGRER